MSRIGQVPTKVNVKINTSNEREQQGRNFYYHVDVLAVVLARRIPFRANQCSKNNLMRYSFRIFLCWIILKEIHFWFGADLQILTGFEPTINATLRCSFIKN